MSRIGNCARLITGEEVKGRIAELEPVMKAPDVIDCDEQRDALLREFSVLKQLDCDVCNVLARSWTHETLVRDSAFVAFLQEQAVDMCGTQGWPLTCVNWDQAANEARMDWLSVGFDGVTYWVR